MFNHVFSHVLFSNLLPSLTEPEVEAELGGSFVSLRQALFKLNSMDSSLLFTVLWFLSSLGSVRKPCARTDAHVHTVLG